MNAESTNNKPVKILFVCLGNICRSPSAQGIMEQLIESKGLQNKYFIDSAGTYAGHAGELPDQRMRIHASRRGYKLTHRSRPVVASDFQYFDMIIGMDDNNIYNLRNIAQSIEEEQKIIPIAHYFRQHPRYDHVPDPYYEGSKGFELVIDLLEDACLNLIDQLEER